MASNIKATAGAIPVKNEKGELVMQKVKVQRYKAGMRPSYARDADEDEEDAEEVFVSDKRTRQKNARSKEKLTVDISREVGTSSDRRLQRLRQAKVPSDRASRLARLRQREAESSDEEEGKPAAGQRQRAAVAEVVEEESESESEDEDAIAARRARLLARARQRADDVEEQADLLDLDSTAQAPQVQRLDLKKREARAGAAAAEESEEESGESEEDSSEYESYTESESEEDTRPMFKPVFVKKEKRLTKLEEEERLAREEERLEALQLQQEEQRKELRGLVESTVQQELQEEMEEGQLNFVDDDDDNANKEEEFEQWKVRELKRIKRDREEREALERERQEIERVHAMTDEEREEYFRANPKIVTNKADKGRMGFMQKYYHKGAFFQDEEEELFKRDVTAPTLEDRFDKTVLPKVMQVKNFGKMSQTKYTHLADQDTTDRSAPWFQNKKLMEKTQSRLGGHKQDFDRPAAKKKKL